MCGIVGIMRPQGAPVSEDEIRTMRDRIAHRGPDGDGMFLEENVGLGHVRLSIQDLSDLAAQPMVSSCQRYVLTYNGEIYNHDLLRKELASTERTIRSTGDTEALLEHLAEYGVDKTLEIIEGMYAFGLWDRQDKTLTLARDRHGIKPLLYSTDPNGAVRFASEMKAIFDRRAEPDLITVNAVLCGLGGTWGDPTVFRGINWVCAGEYLVFRPGAPPERKSFFHVNDFVDEALWRELQGRSTEEIVEIVDAAMQKSIDLRLISDAPVCTFVSGGVDSSLIAALAAQRHPDLKLFHANVVRDSELDAARDLAKSLNIDLIDVAVTDQDVIDQTPLATYHYEMPTGYHHGGCVPFLMVSKLAGDQGMKVVLTGEGSDEYFYGYPHLAIRPMINRYNKITGALQGLVSRLPKLGAILWPHHEDHPAHHLHKLMFRYELEERRGAASDAFSFVPSAKHRDLHAQAIDMVIGNVRTLLHRNDRLGMSAGLESRFPFLGHGLARTAMNLPNRFKLGRTREFGDLRHPFIADKWIVRHLAGKHMPAPLAKRNKFGLRSTFYNRVNIDKEFFRNGFIAEYYRLSDRGLDHLHDSMETFWKEQIYTMEVWGQIFCMGMSVDEAREHGRRHIRPREMAVA